MKFTGPLSPKYPEGDAAVAQLYRNEARLLVGKLKAQLLNRNYATLARKLEDGTKLVAFYNNGLYSVNIIPYITTSEEVEIEVTEELGLWMCWPTSDEAIYGWGDPYTEENEPWGTIQEGFSTSNGLARICTLQGEIDQHGRNVISHLRDWRQLDTDVVLSWDQTGIYSAGILVQSDTNILCACLKVITHEDEDRTVLLWVNGGNNTKLKARFAASDGTKVVANDTSPDFTWDTGITHSSTKDWWWEFDWEGQQLIYNNLDENTVAEIYKATNLPTDTAYTGTINFSSIYSDEDVSITNTSNRDDGDPYNDYIHISASQKLLVKGQYGEDGTLKILWMTVSFSEDSSYQDTVVGSIPATHPCKLHAPHNDYDPVTETYPGYGLKMGVRPGSSFSLAYCSRFSHDIAKVGYTDSRLLHVKLEIGSSEIFNENIYTIGNEWNTYQLVTTSSCSPGSWGSIVYECDDMEEGCQASDLEDTVAGTLPRAGVEYFRYATADTNIDHYFSQRHWCDLRFDNVPLFESGNFSYNYELGPCVGTDCDLGNETRSQEFTKDLKLTFGANNAYEMNFTDDFFTTSKYDIKNSGYEDTDVHLGMYFNSVREEFFSGLPSLREDRYVRDDYFNPLDEDQPTYVVDYILLGWYGGTTDETPVPYGRVELFPLCLDNQRTVVTFNGFEYVEEREREYISQLNNTNLITTFEMSGYTNPKTYYNTYYTMGLLRQPNEDDEEEEN